MSGRWAAIIAEALAGAGAGGRPMALASRLVVADATLECLSDYRQPAMPDRPAFVPEDNLAVWALLRGARKRGATADEKRTALRFVEWREELSRLEALAVSNLTVLLDALATYRAVCAAGGRDDDIAAKMESIEAHVARHWREVTDDMRSDDRLVRSAEIGRACRRHDVIPSWLLNGDEPPRFVPAAHAPKPEPEPKPKPKRRRAAPAPEESEP